jgi:hypothetical protein
MLTQDDLVDLERNTDVYLCGAGISSVGNLSLPTANQFLSTLQALLSELTKEPQLVADAIWGHQGEHPLRFERIVSILGELDSDLTFLDFLKLPYDSSRFPLANNYHFFLANKLREGALILTTNFDALIETAFQVQEPFFASSRLKKLHGAIQVAVGNEILDSPAAKLKTTIKAVSGGMDFQVLNEFQSNLRTILDGAKLTIIGYSLSDGFDITPALRQCTPKRVRYFNYQPGNPELVEGTSNHKGVLLELFHDWKEAGVQIESVDGNVYPLLPQVQISSSNWQPISVRECLEKVVDSDISANQVLARLLYFQDDYVNAARFFDLVSEAATGKVKQYALVERARSASEWDESLGCVEKAKAHVHDIDEQVRLSLIAVDALANLGTAKEFFKYWRDYKYLMKATTGASFKDSLDFGRALHPLSQVLLYKGQFNLSKVAGERSYKLRKELGDAHDAYNGLSLIAILAVFLGDYERATELLVPHKAYANEVNDEISIRELGYFESLIDFMNGNYLESAQRLAKLSNALSIDETLCSDPDLCCLLASSHYALNDLEQSQKISERGLEYALEHGFTFHVAIYQVITGHLAQTDVSAMNKFIRWHFKN